MLNGKVCVKVKGSQSCLFSREKGHWEEYGQGVFRRRLIGSLSGRMPVVSSHLQPGVSILILIEI